MGMAGWFQNQSFDQFMVWNVELGSKLFFSMKIGLDLLQVRRARLEQRGPAKIALLRDTTMIAWKESTSGTGDTESSKQKQISFTYTSSDFEVYFKPV